MARELAVGANKREVTLDIREEDATEAREVDEGRTFFVPILPTLPIADMRALDAFVPIDETLLVRDLLPVSMLELVRDNDDIATLDRLRARLLPLAEPNVGKGERAREATDA